MGVEGVIAAISEKLPGPMRWAGAVAKRMRGFDIGISGKSSGSSNTDALTLADLTVQELLVQALRDADPILHGCRIEAEETTGPLDAFATEGELTISLDPIDGTKQYRDRNGDGYAVMLHLRNAETVLYSLVFIPETGARGTWVEVVGDTIRCGEDDPHLPARAALDAIALVNPLSRRDSRRIYTIGFLDDPIGRVNAITEAGLEGVLADDTPGSIYALLSTGEFCGSLIHSPNVYDFPVSLHIARVLGGDAVWVDTGEPVHFRETWLDEKADMLRLPRIVACSPEKSVLNTLCGVARDWNPHRYTV